MASNPYPHGYHDSCTGAFLTIVFYDFLGGRVGWEKGEGDYTAVAEVRQYESAIDNAAATERMMIILLLEQCSIKVVVVVVLLLPERVVRATIFNLPLLLVGYYLSGRDGTFGRAGRGSTATMLPLAE